MTGRQSFVKEEILERDGYRCTYPGCNNTATSLAHGISKSKVNLRKYGKDIVHHPYNMFSVCNNLEHNAYFNINLFENKIEKLIVLIGNFSYLNSEQVWEALNENV